MALPAIASELELSTKIERLLEMDIAGNCNLIIPEMLPEQIRCREPEACAICGLCISHCLQHFLIDGLVHGKTYAPLKSSGDTVMIREAA